MTRLVTASSLLRAKRCPASYALPQLRETSEAAEQGNENHAAIEAQLRGGVDERSPELRACLVGEGVSHIEAAFVLDVVTGAVRFIGEAIGRDYGTVDETREIPMTLDLVTLREADGVYVVRDWKSRKRVTPAERNDQVRAQAVAVMGFHHVDQVEAGLTYLDNWEQDMATVDVFERAAILAELRETLAKVQAAQPTDPVHLGPWCEYCPAMDACTGRNAALAATAAVLRPDPFLDEQEQAKAIVSGLTPEAAGKLYTDLAALSDMVERAQKLLRDRAKQGPLPLPSGKLLALVESSRTGLDTKKAEALLTAAGIPVPVKTSTFTTMREIKPRKEA